MREIKTSNDVCACPFCNHTVWVYITGTTGGGCEHFNCVMTIGTDKKTYRYFWEE